MPHSKSSEMRTDLAREAVADISDELLLLLSDVFSLFLKTKTLDWHVTPGLCTGWDLAPDLMWLLQPAD
jgi:hypothetical protein